MPKKHLSEKELAALVKRHFWESAGTYDVPFETLSKSEYTLPFSHVDQSMFDPSTKQLNLSQVKMNKNNKITIQFI